MQSTVEPVFAQGKEELLEHQDYLIRTQAKKDSLKFVIKGRYILGFQVGPFLIPGYMSKGEDAVTGVDLRKKKTVYSLSFEYFYSSRLSFGAELNLHGAGRRIDIMSEGFSGGGGETIPFFLFTKYFFSCPTATPYIKSGLNDLDPLTQDVGDELAVQNSINNRKMRRPRAYLLAGVGTVSTFLVKVNGSSFNYPAVSSYRQTVPSGEIGIGLFSRIDKLVSFDLAGKYILSTNYSPSLGGISAYEGFKIEMRIGFICRSRLRTLQPRPADDK